MNSNDDFLLLLLALGSAVVILVLWEAVERFLDKRKRKQEQNE